ncbi:MAG: O-antigen ligase family protein [Candidatus Nanoarchaeia archaeon]
MVKLNWILIYAVILNIALIILRFNISEPEVFTGNITTNVLLFIIFISLLYTFFAKKYDYFLIIWLSFYFASPLIVPTFIEIGSLGILNAIFIPLMLLVSLKLNNKYSYLIILLILFSFFNFYNTSLRIFFSSILQIVAPLVFFYFALKKCKNKELIIYAAILIAIINAPLSIYEFINKPSWGVFSDWRGDRILGNLFHPNSYSMYLLPVILLIYTRLRNKFQLKYFLPFLLLVGLNILTFSRIGLISLFLAIIFIELFYALKTKNMIITTILPLAILSIIILYNFTNISNDHLKLETISERTQIWTSIFPLIKDNLIFGLGAGSYESYRSEIINNLSPHNVYLLILFELGIVGLLLVLFYLFIMSKDLLTKLNSYKKTRKNKKSALLYSGGLAILIGIIIFSFTDSAPFSQVVALNSWILLGSILSEEVKKK